MYTRLPNEHRKEAPNQLNTSVCNGATERVPGVQKGVMGDVKGELTNLWLTMMGGRRRWGCRPQSGVRSQALYG